ncbi:MAG: M20/M25/M40 family metallo-hydrolase [Anaerolineales bacterium]|nr:M20/M25/M40 family metallo-hydrolase [Anaerolineales bacterium]
MSFSPSKFAEKYLLAREAALDSKFRSGTSGFEIELNILDEDFRPVLTVGSGPDQQSFIDYLLEHEIPAWLSDRAQREVFHWMIEWATKPYYFATGAVYEQRLLEAALLNVLAKASRKFGKRLYAYHGNLLYPVRVGHESIPGGWNLAKQRYLRRCVDLFGASLATAGIHANLSLPETLLSWDFLHLSPGERGAADAHLEDYKNRVYIEATRLMRAFAALFIATSASTPLRAEERDGQPVVILTDVDSNRNYIFPNPETLDIPYLYRSHEEYLRLSYDLVRRGVRFGNNNWTPVRARSFAEPVERLILTTSEQLHALYHRGLYAVGETTGVEEMALQIERENLLARINIPMARVEIRTDEGGHPLELDIANLTLKELLLIQCYADPAFARAFRYDHEDIARARRNEAEAAHYGLKAEIENPFTGKPVAMRDFLRWTLEQVRPLAEALEMWTQLGPLLEMASGAPNTAERIRERVRREIGDSRVEVPVEVLKLLALEREAQVKADVEIIAASVAELGEEAVKLREFLQRARDEVRQHDPQAPIRFRPRADAATIGTLSAHYADKTSEVLDLAQQLIRIPSVTNCPEERLDEVFRAATFVFDYLRDAGLDVTYFNRGKYPAVFARFPGQNHAPVMLCGHFDVVPPEPDDTQFEPRVEGDYLWGRGAADMKTVVATYLIWMKDTFRAGGPFPGINLLLVGNEENGESEPFGTPHVLAELARIHDGYAPQFLIAGERTGENGQELMGEICVENRGVMRFEIIARGMRGHTGVRGAHADLSERLFQARAALVEIFQQHLTLTGEGGWQSQYRFPFFSAGQPGVYNVTADYGVLGIEIRSIPQDRLGVIAEKARALCAELGLEINIPVQEDGVACDLNNPYLLKLIEAVRATFGQEPVLGKKLPGSSARFAPGGQAVVWGQSGLGPHAKDERHFIPSIDGYYRALTEFAQRLK